MFTIRLKTIALMMIALTTAPVAAATIRVPGDHKTIQAAVNEAVAGDTVLVAAGTYKERIKLKAGVTLKSDGDNAKGEIGLKRAEATIIDGSGKKGKGAGIEMAEGSAVDGITVTNVGFYDDAKWNKHHATQGEEQSHEFIGSAGTAGIAIIGVNCTITNNIVHHIGYTGIAITGVKGKDCSPLIAYNVTYRNMGGGIGSMHGSTATITRNRCFQNYYAGIGHDDASPTVTENVCYENVRAGIGVSEGSKAIVRNNKCYHNRRAGIGVRTGADTKPIIEGNECYENDMAGIGNRDEAQPIIRNNRCYRNKMAGIGSRDNARALIEGNECFENEMSGIGSRLEAAPVIRNNRCYKNKMAGIGSRQHARPVIEGNECFENGMAGIGSREEAAPVIRNNRCYKNEMAGIGSRLGARPVIVGNECFENKMAGIGSREGAVPIIRDNLCYKNRMAGIGSREGARPVIVENVSRENNMAGIGVRGTSTVALIVGNKCLENRMVAIGLPDGATAYIHGNQLQRTGGGMPPLVALKGNSSAIFTSNTLRGGGVAGVLVQGTVQVSGNRFHGRGPKNQGSAVWIWDNSTVTVTGNRFDGYRNTVNASKSDVTAGNNVVSNFQGPAIVVRKPTTPARVFGNTAISDNSDDVAAKIDEPIAADSDNIVIPTKKAEDIKTPNPVLWPALEKASIKKNEITEALSVTEGPWKLVAVPGKTVRYQLFNIEDDPQQKKDVAEHLEQIVFRLQGLLEQQKGQSFQGKLGGKPPGR